MSVGSELVLFVICQLCPMWIVWINCMVNNVTIQTIILLPDNDVCTC